MKGILVCIVLAGCVEAPDVSTTTADLESANRLSSNALSANRLSSNRLSSNGLADAASAQTLTELADSPEGRELLTYLVSCALPAGQTVTATDSLGAPWVFGGALGLAPDWYTAAPSVADRRWVSACLLARTNAFGVTVPISLRGNTPALAVTSTEKQLYSQYEGGFWGDLWAADPRPTFTCESALAITDPTRSSFPLRRCSDGDAAGDVVGGATVCGFTWTGTCSAACTTKNSVTTCTDTSGTAWAEVIQVYLQR